MVWSDDEVIVVDKPGGAGRPSRRRESLAEHWCRGCWPGFPDLAELADGRAADGDRDRPGIVHRLDKGTSGLLMVARTEAARAGLTAQLAARTGRAASTRPWSPGPSTPTAGLIDAPLGRAGRDPTRMQIQAGGRPARTRYQVEGRYDRPAPSTLVRCRLETGRTHQIRVHLASIGHPVVGDDATAARRPPAGIRFRRVAISCMPPPWPSTTRSRAKGWLSHRPCPPTCRPCWTSAALSAA